jgi:hypothetical protein
MALKHISSTAAAHAPRVDFAALYAEAGPSTSRTPPADSFTADEFAKAVGAGTTEAKFALLSLVKKGKVERLGRFKRGDYRLVYFRKL